MEKISKLLQETQQLLEDFSSGTLSPVSSYFDSEREEEEGGEGSDCYFGFDNFVDKNEKKNIKIKQDSDQSKEFRELLRSKDFSNCIKLIESWGINSKFPKMALHMAVEENCKDSEIFKALLRIGCDPLKENSDHKTALTLLLEQKETVAIVSEDNCLISSLLGEWELRKASMAESELFKKIHERNWKSLYKFLQEQHHQIDVDPIKLLCKADAKFAGLSPLHEIAAINDVATLKKLLNKFKMIDLNVKSIGNGNTPLHEATHMSATEMVLFLLESGARFDIKNAAGKVPAHLGTEKIQVLIEFKTSSRKSLPNSMSSDWLEPKNNSTNTRNSSMTPTKSEVNVLVHVPKITQKDDVIRKSHSSNLSSKKTADLFVQTTKSASNESLSREERKLKQIIGFLDQIEKHKDHAEKEQVIKEDKPKINNLESKLILQREPTTGRTILHRYARRNHFEKLLKFLKANPKISGSKRKLKAIFEVVDNKGFTPLHEAAIEGSFEVAKILLFGHHSINNNKLSNHKTLIDPSIASSTTGDTPLHEAAYAGHFKIVQLLLNVGGDKRIKNMNGKIPVDLTKSKKIRKLLLNDEIDDDDVDSENSETESDEEFSKKNKKKLEKKEKQEMNTNMSAEKLIKTNNSNGSISVTVPAKRGPGRPRKYPRVDEEKPEEPHNVIKEPVEIIRPVTVIQESNYLVPEPKISIPPLIKEYLPLKSIFGPENESILVVKLNEQIGWCLIADQFLKICEYLGQRRKNQQTDYSIDEHEREHEHEIINFNAKYSRYYHQISPSDRQQILQLPPLGRLVEILNYHLTADNSNSNSNNANGSESDNNTSNSNTSLLTLIPKPLAVKLLNEDFNFSLNGPFGYIDVKKIIKRLPERRNEGVKTYSGCPLKLKMKLDRLKEGNKHNQNNNSIINHNNHSNHNSPPLTTASTALTPQFSLTYENPKSPKTFQF